MDDFDRKILSRLVEDATISYVRLGKMIGLSAPAVHERVKRMKQSNVIQGVSALVDAKAVGKPLMAFIHIDFNGWGKSGKLTELSRFPEVEEMHSVAGDTGMILKVRTSDTHALELFLSQLYELDGVKTTRSYICLSTFLERPTQAEITQDWPAMKMSAD